MSFRSNIFGQRSDLFGEITDLSTGDIYGKGAELFFTPPWSTYAISHYVVFVDGFEQGNISEIDCAIDLIPENSHQVYIQPVDVNGNIGSPSNTITINTPVWQTFLFDNFPQISAIYGLKRLTSSAIYAVRVQRDSDLAETDIEFPASGFVGLDSMTSAGQTLEDWIGVNTAMILTIYDQQGNNDLTIVNKEIQGFANLVENGVLVTESSMPSITIYKNDSFISLDPTGMAYAKKGFEGAASVDRLTEATVIDLMKTTDLVGRDANYWQFNKDDFDIVNDLDKWSMKTDNSQRFYGTNIQGVQPVQEKNLRSNFKKEYIYSSWINGELNIVPTEREGTDTYKYVYGLGWQRVGGSPNLPTLLNVVSILDLRRIRRLIEQQINIEFNNYTTL